MLLERFALGTIRSDQGATTATLRLTAESVKNLSAVSGVACKKIGAIIPSLAAPNPAPKTCHTDLVRKRVACLNSLAQADAPLDILKARIVPQIVEMRPHLDENQICLAIFASPLQSFDREILLHQTVIDDGRSH
jgi:hypothetical protein